MLPVVPGRVPGLLWILRGDWLPGSLFYARPSWIKQRKTRTGLTTIVCYRCGVEIVPGDFVQSRTNAKYPIKYYHKECWEGLWLDV